MELGPAQSIAIFLILVLMASAPGIVSWALRHDQEQLPETLTGRDALAYMLYAEHCRGDQAALERYGAQAQLREPWLTEADRRLECWYGKRRA